MVKKTDRMEKGKEKEENGNKSTGIKGGGYILKRKCRPNNKREGLQTTVPVSKKIEGLRRKLGYAS